MNFNKRSDEEIEVSIIGGGNAYGECIVINLGYNSWVIIDSAHNPKTNEPLAIEYLNGIGVDVTQNVKYIIATHWHGDHIRGLAKCVDVCTNAKFCCSAAFHGKTFMSLIGLVQHNPDSKTKEFQKILEIIVKRKKVLKHLKQDLTLSSFQHPNNIPVQIISLSPSDHSINNFIQKDISPTIAKFIENPSNTLKNHNPNDSSVVVLIKIGEHEILLSGDLENSSHPDMGWNAVLSSSLVPEKSVSIFKVPHHGSKTSYNKDIWNELLVKDSIAGLTPYSKSKLPREEDVKSIYSHTEYAFITSDPNETGKKSRKSNVKKFLRKLNQVPAEIKFNKGQIRFKKPMLSDKDSPWSTELLGKAIELKELYNLP